MVNRAGLPASRGSRRSRSRQWAQPARRDASALRAKPLTARTGVTPWDFPQARPHPPPSYGSVPDPGGSVRHLPGSTGAMVSRVQEPRRGRTTAARAPHRLHGVRARDSDAVQGLHRAVRERMRTLDPTFQSSTAEATDTGDFPCALRASGRRAAAAARASSAFAGTAVPWPGRPEPACCREGTRQHLQETWAILEARHWRGNARDQETPGAPPSHPERTARRVRAFRALRS